MCNNATHLFVKVTATYGFQDKADKASAWVGTDESDLPVPEESSSGRPISGHFPYKNPSDLTGNEWGFIVELKTLKSIDGNPVGCNAFIYIYLHANVFDSED